MLLLLLSLLLIFVVAVVVLWWCRFYERLVHIYIKFITLKDKRSARDEQFWSAGNVHESYSRKIHEVRSSRSPKSKERLRRQTTVQTAKSLYALAIFAYPNLAFDLVTRRDLAH